MPDNLAQFIAEFRVAKKERDAEFAKLMEAAVAAGDRAAACVDPGRVRGAAWVRLADGRLAFARFAREHCEGQWLRGNREMGNYLPAPFEFLDQALAWADAVAEKFGEAAVAEKFSEAGVEVTVGHKVLGEAGG